MSQAGNPLIKMEKKRKTNEHCLSLLTTINEMFNFVFFSEHCLFFHRLH